MTLWIILFFANLLTPGLMIGFGRLFQKSPPEKINSVYGYRTAMSMKNQDTWEFAHRYNGKVWYTAGMVMLPITILAMILLLWTSEAVITIVGSVICILQLLVLLGTIPIIEKALRETFDKNGNRK